MYFNGDCINNHYMYEGISIDPIHLILFLNSMSINKTINLKKSEAIPNDLCSIILLPYSGRKLINPKYYDFMDSCKILYESENCKICKKLNNKVNKEVKVDKEVNEETNKKYKEHKKSHNNLLKSDIIDIQKRFNQLVM